MRIMKTRISLESKDLNELHESLAHFILLFDRGNEELSELFFRQNFVLKENRNWLGFPVTQKDKDEFVQKHKEHIKNLEDFVHTIVAFNVDRAERSRAKYIQKHPHSAEAEEKEWLFNKYGIKV